MRSLGLLWMVPLLGLLAMLQATVMGLVTIYGVKPDLILIFILIWTLLFGSKASMVWAFIGGIWLDIFGGGPLGASSLSLMSAAIVGGIGYMTLSRFNVVVPVVTIVVGSLTFYLTYLAILQIVTATGLFTGALSFLPAVESIVIPATLYNTMLMLVVLPVINRMPQGVEPLQ
ncbi:MAG: rod shape-determining protein MreD [Chloroflexota bacterium]